jgi:cytochrome c oxidase subunit 4
MADAAHRHHPTTRQYWEIALILGVITAAEVAVTYMDALGGAVVPLLLIMAVAKFWLVVAFFMHLRFEKRIYRNLFLIGIIATPLLFGAVLFTFGVLIG